MRWQWDCWNALLVLLLLSFGMTAKLFRNLELYMTRRQRMQQTIEHRVRKQLRKYVDERNERIERWKRKGYCMIVLLFGNIQQKQQQMFLNEEERSSSSSRSTEVEREKRERRRKSGKRMRNRWLSVRIYVCVYVCRCGEGRRKLV